MNYKNPRSPVFLTMFSYASSMIMDTEQMQNTPTSSPPESPKKKVSFFNTKNVILIPKREEYIQANLSQHIWLNQEEYNHIKIEIFNEVNEFVEKNPSFTKKEAFNLIYELDGVHPDNLHTNRLNP